jgi:hypothetical protein
MDNDRVYFNREAVMAKTTKHLALIRGILAVMVIFLSISVYLIAANAGPSPMGEVSPQSVADSYLMAEQKVSIELDPDAHRYRPQVAFNYNHNEYLVVWHNTWANGQRYVYARRLDINGKPLGNVFALTNIVTNQVHPFVVYNGVNDVYFVVWMYDVSMNGTRYEIWGSIIPWNATTYGTVFRIGDLAYPYDMWYPSAAWNSLHNEYLVTWDTYYYDGSVHVPQSIGYRRVAADGTPGTIGTITTAKAPQDSDIVYNTLVDEYVVVWTRKEDDVSTNHFIQGALLNWDATIAQAEYFVYDGGWDDHRNPAIATDLQYYMVVLEAKYDWVGHWGSCLLPINLSGNILDDYCYFQTVLDFINPDIVARGAGGEWLWVWEDQWSSHSDVTYLKFSYVYPTYDLIDSESLFTIDWYRRLPAVAGGGPGYLFTYTGRSSDPDSWQHIYATKLWQSGIFLPLVIR